MSNAEHTFNFKITVVGDGRVGKTSLIKKYTQGTFEKDYIKTIGAQFSKYYREIGNDRIRLIFWDIAGQDELNFLRPSFYRESKAAIIVYSLEENQLGSDSFEHVTNWHEDIKQFCGDIPIVVFCNKVDLVDEKNLDISSVQKLIKEREFLGYFLTSAKTGQGVIDAFNTIIDDLYNKARVLT